MTREGAIGNLIHAIRWNDIPKKEALEMAIKALEQEPCNKRGDYIYPTDIVLETPNTATSMPCEDAISRQAVLDLMRSLTRWCVRSEDGKFNNVGLLYDDVMFGIDKLPSVKPQYTDDEIQKMQDLEQAEIQKAYELGKVETGRWIKNLCDSCTNKACEFQSGIQRSKCDFYIPPMPYLEPDNCGNYVVQQEPKTGRWITKDGKEQGYDIGGLKTWYIQIMCSECGFIKTAIEGHTGQYHYCPHCGAKMAQESEEQAGKER